MSKTAQKTDPKLWDKVKSEVTRGRKGGEPGQWSARKAQLAVQEYKKRGGGYLGAKSDEDWGTKSGRNSRETSERYLPKKARKALADRDQREEGRRYEEGQADLQPAEGCYRENGAATLRRRYSQGQTPKPKQGRIAETGPLSRYRGPVEYAQIGIGRRDPALQALAHQHFNRDRR